MDIDLDRDTCTEERIFIINGRNTSFDTITSRNVLWRVCEKNKVRDLPLVID